MSKYRLNHETVVDGAVELVNQRGAGALSLAELAARFRVRTPSLYNHVQGLDGLRRDLALRGMRDLTERVRAASTGLAGKDALGAIADAYRVYARQNPGVYGFTLRSVEGEDEEMASASATLLEVLLAALRGYRLEGDPMIHAARAVRSALHGFVSLEIAGGFGMPVDLEASYGRLVELLDTGLRAMGKR